MRHSYFIFFLRSVFGIFLLNGAVLAADSSTTINFSATFLAGSCDIAVQPSVVNWGAVSSSDIRAALRPGVAPRQLDVSYTNCSGYGISPKLEIIGSTLNGTVPEAGIPLFSSSEGTTDAASAYGVRIALLDDIGTALDSGAKIELTDAAGGLPLTNLHDNPTRFQASLSCGDCVSQSLQGGLMSASVTFRFLYE